jgi:GT2 family glycosyltransferase
MPRVSVVVPIFNGVPYLPSFFVALQRAMPPDCQVILVDDASTERIWETVPDLTGADQVLRFQNERNLGYAATVNRGFAAATGDVVVALNTDLVLQPRCIDAMTDLIACENDVGIVGSKLVFPTTGLVQHVGMAFGNATKPLFFRELPSSHPLSGRTRQVQMTAGATAAMSRRVLDRLGPLDEGFFNHNEDVDHCLRATRLGLRNFVCGDAVAHHWESKSGPSRFARVATAEALFWARWGGSAEVDLDRFVDEALDYLLDQHPHLKDLPFEVLDLSRGPDRSLALHRLGRHWPGIGQRIRHFRQMNNASDRLWLPLLLPQWVVDEPVPFVYLVDGYRELEENDLWFENRRKGMTDEFVLDLTGVALHTSELPFLVGREAVRSAEITQ